MRRTHFSALAAAALLSLSLLSGCGAKAGQGSQSQESGGLLAQIQEKGEIVVAMIGEEATVKRLHRERGETWLLPENDDYDPIDGSEAVILGRVTAVIRQY